MLQRLRTDLAARAYPRQFWLLFLGMLISTIGSSMIWPFLMVYSGEKLGLPLAATAGLMTVNSVMGLLTSFVGGLVVDRLGRKWVMGVSLLLNGCGYLLLSQADTLAGFAVAMAVNGAFNPLYRVGADAMLADLIAPEKRAEAYALMRMSNNVGVALGPAIGGFVAAISYTISFVAAASGLAAYGLLVLFFAAETLPRGVPRKREALGGYGTVLRDRRYLGFVGSYILVSMTMALIWVLLSVYTKRNFGVPENLYGWIPTTNALLVIAFQYVITLWTRKRDPLVMMALGSGFYAAAALIIAFAGGFWGFWLAMVVMTIGELVLVPTSSTYAANLAPADMRGRYMSLYGLSWPIAAGISPVTGGWLSDVYGPRSPWYGGVAAGLAAVLGFLWMRRVKPSKE